MHFTKEELNFSQSELVVLSLVKEGLSTKEIAKELTLSEDAIEGYRRNMIKMTGAKNMIVVVYAAKTCGLI